MGDFAPGGEGRPVGKWSSPECRLHSVPTFLLLHQIIWLHGLKEHLTHRDQFNDQTELYSACENCCEDNHNHVFRVISLYRDDTFIIENQRRGMDCQKKRVK